MTLPERPIIKTTEPERSRLGILAEEFLDDVWEWDVLTGVFTSAHVHQLSGLGGTVDRDVIQSLIHVDDRALFAELLAELASGKRERFQVEFRFQRWDNRWATVLTRAAVVARDGRGAPVRVLGSSVDVTDRVERAQPPRAADPTAVVDDRLVQTQKLESLGLLAGGIAHDFNNLLMAVVAEATLAKDEPGLTAPTREALDQIELAAQRMAELTRQLLAYAGRARFVVEKLDPDHTVQELSALLKRSIRRDAKLTLELGGGAPVIEADASKLGQVVMNLVINASDALGAAGGNVWVRSFVERDANPPSWKLEVSDDGEGMDETTRTRIFDPFFTTKVTGHGLGLSAVLGIVNQLKGTITVESSPGTGARFVVRLPLNAGVAGPAVQRSGKALPLTGRRALVADDEESVRVAVRRMLERRGAVVNAVADGREARAAMARESYDLMFLDVNMPAGGAYDLLPEARTRQPTSKVVLMSGYSESFTAKPGALDVDGDAFLQKPFSLAQLDDALRALLT